MRYVMLTAQEVLQLCELVRRFIDDIMLIFIGTLESAEELKACMAEKFAKVGLKLTFRHVHAGSDAKEVEFMDVNHVMDAEDLIGFVTKDFVKPTAVGRVFLNGSSYHPISTFKSILKGECLRMRRLNEKKEDFEISLERLKEKALRSNFPKLLTKRIVNTASLWESRFAPSRQNGEETETKILTWATAHPKLITLSERQHELKPAAVVTFKKPANLSTHLIHFRKLCHKRASNEHTHDHSPACGKCSLCSSWGPYNINMVYESPNIENKITKQQFNIRNNLNCRNFGIYAAICKQCPAIYVGQTVTPFKDRWSKHRSDWKNNWINKNVDCKNDQAALRKHYLARHPDQLQWCSEISSAWKVAFLEEPSVHLIDMRETHWRDLLEDKKAIVNIQKMVWPRVK